MQKMLLSAMMMTLAAALCAPAAQAECTPPTPSEIPDGATAGEAEMIAAMKAFKQYDAAASQYIKCLEEETAQLLAKRSPSERGSVKAKQVELHNDTIDALQAAATRFNKQVRVYKDRTKSAKN